jgi:hypothetical protein
MSTRTVPPPEETGVDDRTVRAATEHMTVYEEVPEVYGVASESGSEYTVDRREPACTCPDFRYRDVECKHIKRVRMAVGAVDVEDLERQFETRAADLEADADRFERRAEQLRERASKLEAAMDRLQDVASESGPMA